MGLLSILKKVRQKEKEMRLLMLGLDNAGKTTILKKINGEPTDTISPTLGFNIRTLEHNGFTVNVWDIGKRVLRGRKRAPHTTHFGLDRRTEESALVLEELLRANGCHCLGCGLDRPATSGRLQGGVVSVAG